LHVVKAEA